MRSKFYKEVKTFDDYQMFYDMLRPSWLEMGYELECVLGDVSRFIIFNMDQVPVGTVEFIKYNTIEDNYIDQLYPFKKDVPSLLDSTKVYEIESVSILPEYRNNNNLDFLLYTILEFSRLNKVTFGLATINPLLYIALKNTYRIPIKRLNGKITKGRYQVYPIIIDLEKIYKNINNFPWGEAIYKYDGNLAWKVKYIESDGQLICT